MIDHKQELPIPLWLTARAVLGSVGQVGTEIRLLPKVLSHLLEPSPRVRAVDNAPQETQAFPDVVPIVPDILLGDPSMQAEETLHASWFGKDLGGMAQLRCFDDNRLLQVENVLTAKQVDASGAA